MKSLPRATMVVMPLLLLAACGDGKDDAPISDPEADTSILEGTIDDSMIDLTGGQTAAVPGDGASEGTDQPAPEPKADTAEEDEAETPADEPAPAEPADSADDAGTSE